MAENHYKNSKFLISVARMNQLPDDMGIEVAFAGRSNAGKSSVINVLTEQKSLARTSKTPGRTQLLNFFSIDSDRRIVDLPGYGYAKVPEEMKAKWASLLTDYVETRACLSGLILITDVRRGLTDQDRQMLEWLEFLQLPVHVLLNKADKLSNNQAKQALLKVNKTLNGESRSFQLFSALKKTGLVELKHTLNQWYFKQK